MLKRRYDEDKAPSPRPISGENGGGGRQKRCAQRERSLRCGRLTEEMSLRRSFRAPSAPQAPPRSTPLPPGWKRSARQRVEGRVHFGHEKTRKIPPAARTESPPSSWSTATPTPRWNKTTAKRGQTPRSFARDSQPRDSPPTHIPTTHMSMTNNRRNLRKRARPPTKATAATTTTATSTATAQQQQHQRQRHTSNAPSPSLGRCRASCG